MANLHLVLRYAADAIRAGLFFSRASGPSLRSIFHRYGSVGGGFAVRKLQATGLAQYAKGWWLLDWQTWQ
jgi:hypothetical protein